MLTGRMPPAMIERLSASVVRYVHRLPLVPLDSPAGTVLASSTSPL